MSDRPCLKLRSERYPCAMDGGPHVCIREAGHDTRHFCQCGREWARLEVFETPTP